MVTAGVVYRDQSGKTVENVEKIEKLYDGSILEEKGGPG
jgi:hypothetical protein